jgi:hypothetical protein
MANAKCDGIEFGDWLRTPMGQLGLTLTDDDATKLHKIFAEAEGIRLH